MDGIWATAQWPHRLILWALALCLYPVFNNFYWGQINTVVLLLVVIGLWLKFRGQAVWAGIFIALASFIKITPAIIIYISSCGVLANKGILKEL